MGGRLISGSIASHRSPFTGTTNVHTKSMKQCFQMLGYFLVFLGIDFK